MKKYPKNQYLLENYDLCLKNLEIKQEQEESYSLILNQDYERIKGSD